MKGWGFGSRLFVRHFIDEEKKQWTCTALICSPVSANISWCFLSRHAEFRPVLRSKLLLGSHRGAPCHRGRVGWDANTWLSTGILTKHTACFSSNYIYPTNAWFDLHANEISLVRDSVLMNNNNVAVRIISARISFSHSEFSQKPFPCRFIKSNRQKALACIWLQLTSV